VPTFLLHHAYDHAPNALVSPPLSAAGNIDNDERCPAGRDNNERHPEGWDGPERGGARHPPTAAAIVVIIIIIGVVVIVNDWGSGMGANDQHPTPHATKGRPADDVATVIVRFSPSSALPCNPFPSSALSYSLLLSYSLPLLSSSNRHSSSYSPPPPPSPSHPLIVCNRMPAQIPAEALTCTTPVRAQDVDCKVGCILAR
jgi:hypothetical protein